jgi:hypothetical protein
MSERQPYTYVLLRYRHDPLAGEFANVGVVLHAPRGRFLAAKLRATAGPRLTRMFPAMSVRAFRTGLQSIERGIAKLASRDGGDLLSTLGDASMLARRVLPVDDSSFVWDPVGSGLSVDPAQTLAKLYERFVTQFDARPKGSAHDDATVWRPVHDLLVARDIADRLSPKTISSAADQVEFEHAWKNGAWHVYQPLSFDLSTDDHIRDKAAKWAGHLLGLSGADEDFRPHFIVGPPSSSAMRDAYERALDLLRLPEAGAEVVEVSEAAGLVDRIAEAVRAHEGAG